MADKIAPILNPALAGKFKLVSKHQKIHVGGFGTVDFSLITEEKANALFKLRPNIDIEKVNLKEDTKAPEVGKKG